MIKQLHLPQPNIALVPIEMIKGEHFNIRVGDPNDTTSRTVDRLFTTWLDENCDPIQVRMDNDGMYHIVDGMHRYAVMVRLGHTHVWCRITNTAGVRDAAAHFVTKQQGTTPLKASHVFVGKLAQLDTTALAIKAAADKYGISIKDLGVTDIGKKPKAIMGIDTITGLVRTYGLPVVDAMMSILSSAFPDNPLGFRAPMMTACALFVATYDSRFGNETYRVANVNARLAERLPYLNIPEALARATSWAATYKQPKHVVLARSFLDAYNTNMRTNRLPDVLPASKTAAKHAAQLATKVA